MASGLAAGLGAGCALAVARGTAFARIVILTGLIILLALPAPPLYALPEPSSYVPLLGATARALALVALFCIPSAAAIPRGLRRAARVAGATPFRAWCDAVLAQIWLPACVGVIAAWLRR